MNIRTKRKNDQDIKRLRYIIIAVNNRKKNKRKEKEMKIQMGQENIFFTFYSFMVISLRLHSNSLFELHHGAGRVVRSICVPKVNLEREGGSEEMICWYPLPRLR